MADMIQTADSHEPLTALFNEWERAHAEHQAAFDRHAAAETLYLEAERNGNPSTMALKRESKQTFDASGVASDRENDLMTQIMSTRTRDLSGMAVKIRVAAFYAQEEGYGDDLSASPSDRAIIGLLADIEGVRSDS
jgi:hypothetical protein